jgi:hypothetical protein
MHYDSELERLFSIPETCRILGFERSALYTRIRAGRLKAVKLDGHVKIPATQTALAQRQTPRPSAGRPKHIPMAARGASDDEPPEGAVARPA